MSREEQLAALWVAKALAPDPQLTVSEWADQHRVLPPSVAWPGPWRTSRTPYLREPMDRMSVSDPTGEVVLVLAAQLGKSEVINNALGYMAGQIGSPALLVLPTDHVADSYSKRRIHQLIKRTPMLQRQLLPGETLQEKLFSHGGQILIRGAQTPSKLAELTVRLTAEDEVDRFPQDVQGEGDPSSLLKARKRTFGERAKHLRASTPTEKVTSAIWAALLASDHREYMLPCPECGHWQDLCWERMRWDAQDPGIELGRLEQPPVLICQSCKAEIREQTKAWWYDPRQPQGEWVPRHPGRAVKGYHLGGFYAPLGWLRWDHIVLDYLDSEGDLTARKTWTNTVLALPWEEEGGEVATWEELLARARATGHRRGEVPAGGLVVTLAADVQGDRIEWELVAWGERMESWSVDYGVIWGDPRTLQVEDEESPWLQLEGLWQVPVPLEGGGALRPELTLVDSSAYTQTVYGWVRRQGSKRVRAIKGSSVQASAVTSRPSLVDVSWRGRSIRRGVKLWNIGVNVIKEELISWLKLQPADDGQHNPAGYCHFPADYEEEYFLGLTAEELRTTQDKRGVIKREWWKIRPRNEPWDLRVYNRAAASMLGLDRWTAKCWAAWRQRVEEQAGSGEAEELSDD